MKAQFWTQAAVYGGVLWYTRRRRKQIRTQLLHEMQEMLQERIYNQLSIIQLHADLADAYGEVHPKAATQISGAVQKVKKLLDNLSEETLYHWQAQYQQTLDKLYQVTQKEKKRSKIS